MSTCPGGPWVRREHNRRCLWQFSDKFVFFLLIKIWCNLLAEVGERRDLEPYLKRIHHMFKPLVLHSGIWPHVCSSFCNGLSPSVGMGCLNAVVISGCWAAFVLAPVAETPGWGLFKWVPMLDVLPFSYGVLVPQCQQTVMVLSITLFPLLDFTEKPKCSHTWFKCCRSSSKFFYSSARHDNCLISVLPIIHAHSFFFLFFFSMDHLRSEPWRVIRIGHGPTAVCCTTSCCTLPCCVVHWRSFWRCMFHFVLCYDAVHASAIRERKYENVSTAFY